MARELGIAGVQMKVRPGDVNLESMDRLIGQVLEKAPWVELILFPELCVYGKNPDFAEPVPGPTTAKLGRLAAKHQVWLVAGSLYETAPGGYYNTTPVFDPHGGLAATYRKMFPWRPFEKSLAGEDFCVFDIPGKGRVGLCICYDQWFPEVSRQLAWMGAEVIVNPVMTGTADRSLELILARANAITNQVWFLSVNGLEEGGNGQSLLVDPHGEVLQQCGRQEEIIACKLDMDMVPQARQEGIMGLSPVYPEFLLRRRGFPVYCAKE
jgi:predicted amidohydrolase